MFIVTDVILCVSEIRNKCLTNERNTDTSLASVNKHLAKTLKSKNTVFFQVTHHAIK